MLYWSLGGSFEIISYIYTLEPDFLAQKYIWNKIASSKLAFYYVLKGYILDYIQNCHLNFNTEYCAH